MQKSKILLALGLVLGLAGCGKPPSKPSAKVSAATGADGTPLGPDGKPVEDLANVPMAASLASFEANIYGPILAPYCSSCHADSFAPAPQGDGTPPPGFEKAHEAFLTRSHLNAFAGIDQTLPVTKMNYKTGGHNC